MNNFLQDRRSDLQYALRMIRKSPGISAVAIFSLALGIGANTAIFTLVDAVLLKMLPVKDPQGLYVVTNEARRVSSWTHPDYAALRDQNRSLEGLVAYSSVQPFGFALPRSADQRADVAQGVFVSGNYFRVLGVDAAAGRTINEEDDRNAGGGPYIVLSHAFWRKRFVGDHHVIGSGARLNGYPFTVIGVARAGFSGIEVGVAPDFYMPITMRTEVTGNAMWQTRYNSWLLVTARLKPSATIGQAETELSVLNKEQELKERRSLGPEARVNPGRPVTLLPGAQGHSFLRTRLSEPLMVLMAVVAIVLMIACANIANLLLARAAGRQHEIAVRLAMGATRKRLAAQLLTEAGVISVVGGIAGARVRGLRRKRAHPDASRPRLDRCTSGDHPGLADPCLHARCFDTHRHRVWIGAGNTGDPAGVGAGFEGGKRLDEFAKSFPAAARTRCCTGSAFAAVVDRRGPVRAQPAEPEDA